MKRLLLSILVLLCAFSIYAQNPPKRELRGVWISTHISLDWPNRTQTPTQQQTALRGILDHNKATGMNAAYFQVRSQSDAMYPSTLEPWSYYLTNNQGTPPSPLWDPLQYALDETKKRGMEFHAWINPYRAVATATSQNNTALYSSTHVSRSHPEWMLTVGNVKILNPGLAEVRDHVTNVIVDIVKRYDVDGIHFDDYFYPTGVIADDAAYNADPRGFPATAAGRADWRRDNVNLLIKRVSDSINVLKPWVKFGVSPSGIYRSSTDPSIGSPTSAGALQHYSSLFADTKKWIQSGWVDYLTPQVYWFIGQTGSDYKLLVPWWNNNAYGRHIYIGMADYKVNTAGWTSRSEIPNQVRINRANPNVFGQTHFRHAFLVGNLLNYRDSLRQRFYNKPALLPAMTWKDGIAPLSPDSLKLTKGSGSVLLAWKKPAVAISEFDKVKRFAIYRSSNPVIDKENANNLIGITNQDENNFTDNTVAADSIYYYAVTSLDRLYNESRESNIVSNDTVKPVVLVQNISRTLVNGTVSITAADIDNGSSDNWGIASMELSRTSFDCSNIGANTVKLTVTDLAGNIDSATAVVTIIGRIPAPMIALSRSNDPNTGLPNNTIALGYGAQTIQLSASDNSSANGNTYTWSPASGLSSTTGSSVTFTPTAAGTYTFTVEAKSESGCVATQTVTIKVIDVRCGDKVLVYKNPGKGNAPCVQLCIAPQAVPALLATGATLGECPEGSSVVNNIEEFVVNSNENNTLKAYPNPFNTQLSLTFTLDKRYQKVSLEIYSLAGYKIQTVYSGEAKANETYTFAVDASGFQGQFFNARLVTPDKVYNFRLVKE
ncbi:MAG: family 10 glycosylhydrolase [Daejeonella sp.]|uniref:family 10 glycosylhydrolase n=1 Tax=Daejeonella sp. TaxID=2805397 RepID=UPI003C772FFA